MGLEHISQIEPVASLSTDGPLEALVAMYGWVELESRAGMVPEVRWRKVDDAYECEAWLHAAPGEHDDRLPPCGFGHGASLNEAWFLAFQELDRSLFQRVSVPP